MDTGFEFCDELGPAKIIHVHDPVIGLKAVLVVDNVAIGPSIGGLRMAPDVTTEECFRLARAMTLKNAAAGLKHGGGKSVMVGDPAMPKADKEKLIRAMAYALRSEDMYIFGPDMGTDEECMAWVHDEIGRAVGLPREIGGIPLDELGATGYGLAAAADVAADFGGLVLSGSRVAVQGFGSVGIHAARFLKERGCVLVAAADSKGMVHHPDGLDIDALATLKANGKSVVDFNGGKTADRDGVITVDCDVLVPAARPDVIHEDNVDDVKAKLILQGANIPATIGAERRLQERGVINIPDFIANAGGVICAAMEYAGASETAAFEAIGEKIRANTREVLETARNRKLLIREAAVAMATERVKKAMTFRRWALF
ncbi:MAG: Glu/Leu/Phe/Val dehydrogenase [Alphaproteobacteria bacterium]|nr:Glu/Leu/Phe/Val dehydrogenase [Alphaproteobacteria bacterium]